MNLVEIILPNALDRGFDYSVPSGVEIQAGQIVVVSFSGRKMLGIVRGEGKSNLDSKKIKPISETLDFPPLKQEFVKFIEWSAWYNAAALGAMVKMVLPISDIDKVGRLVAINKEANPEIITNPELSAEQSLAADSLISKLKEGFSVNLLDGVTGSGKTEVYFEVIARLLGSEKEGAQILVLLPEIALSVQWLARFRARFGFEPLLWNSNVTPARKRAAWKMITNGSAKVIIGARSALFLPYKNLSLLVVDEEHDSSYKQEEGVIYHARDMSVARARHENFPVVLVSATPSLETVWNVEKGKYTEVTLPFRHALARMPEISLIDMRKEQLERDSFISDILREAVSASISIGNQAMLFLNRRGYAPLVLCRKCGYRFQCPNCSAWLIQHKKKSSLQCHHCDYRIALPSDCPECSAKDSLHACGPGVERIVEEAQRLLPNARIASLASDSVTNHQELKEILLAFERREIDLLVGTQILAKGHHFSGLSVVGVIDADLGLAGGDLRAAEKTYQLLHQVSGRAGREQIRGYVYLQSYQPEHPVMQALLGGDREAFFAAELQARKYSDMPPFSRLAALIIDGGNEQEVIKTCKILSKLQPVNDNVKIYGPAPAALSLLRGRFRYRFLVHAKRNVNLPDYMLAWTSSFKSPKNLRIKIDIDPMSFM